MRRFKQLDFFEDTRDATGAPVFEQRGVVLDLPVSICKLVDGLGGDSGSGQQRAVITDDADDALWQLMLQSVARYGWGGAAKVVLDIVKRDENYVAPHWVANLFDQHLHELEEHVARSRDYGRETDYSDGDDT